MVSAIQSALSGLHTASTRFNEAAADIVRSGAEAVSAFSIAPGEPASQDGSTTTDNLATSNLAAIFADEGPSLAESLISLKEAEILYKSSAKLLGMLLRTEGELLDIDA